MKAAVAAAALLLAVAAVPAQDLVRPRGEPETDAVVRDPEFGVSARHFGLERRVEMLQWQRADGGYRKVWSGEAIDSRGFAPGHDNPEEMPLPGRRWLAAITLDGKPLPEEVVLQLGEWRRFRPGFTALPGNLAATFQPEGDGLGSAENPLDPEIGDLRVHWRELTLPPVHDRLALRDGRWALVPGGDSAATPARMPAHRAWLLGAGALVLLLAAAAWLGRRRKARG